MVDNDDFQNRASSQQQPWNRRKNDEWMSTFLSLVMSSCWMVPTLKEGTHVNTVEAMQESFCKIIVDTLDGVIVQLRNKPEQIHTTYRILRENVDILTSGGCV